MKLKPVSILTHQKSSGLALRKLSKAAKKVATTRSYLQLVTRHGVSSEKAKLWLGLSE